MLSDAIASNLFLPMHTLIDVADMDDWFDNCNVVPTSIDKCNLHVIDKTAESHNKQTLKDLSVTLVLSHTPTQTCWCIMLTQSILDQLIAVVVSSLNYLANISIYTWSCMRTHCDWHAHHMYIHMRSIVVDMHNPPCNSYTLHVCPANFWVVACVSRRCNQFDHWDIMHAWCCYYILYYICDIQCCIYLSVAYVVHIACDTSEHKEHVRPQHQNIKNILSNHNKHMHRETTTPEHIEHTLKS